MFARLATVQSVTAAVMALTLGMGLGTAVAAPPVIGTPAIGRIVAKGAFRVDHSTVTGNATLFEGATIESGIDRPAMEFASGAKLSLGAESKVRVFGDHMVLERGQSRLDKAAGFRVEARGLTIQPETGNATGRVELAGASRVQVAALTGSFRVLNARGMVVAKIPTGIVLAFEPQAAAGPARITGRLVNKGGHYLLTDETTNVTVEVAGANLARLVGQRVEVTGSMDPTATPVSDASQFIRVDNVKLLSGAGTAAAGSGGAASAAGGLSGLAISGTTIAIIGGVAAAAVVGGLAASGGLSGGATTPVSR
jgi:hypothetical protein